MKTRKQVEAGNKKFLAMNRVARRKAIFKDMLLMRQSSQYQFLAANGYIQFFDTDGFNDIPKEDLQLALCNDAIDCEVCLRGAAVLSRIRLGDGEKNLNRLKYGLDDSGKKILTEEFTLRELNIMEVLFENNNIVGLVSSKDLRKIKKMWSIAIVSDLYAHIANIYGDLGQDRLDTILKIAIKHPGDDLIDKLLEHGKRVKGFIQ